MSETIDFGIDLGTTNSSIAVCRRGEVRVFQTTDLMNITPSVVYVSKTGRMLVGKKAYDTWLQDPMNTQAEFKRWMGYSDRLKFPASGKEFAAEELSAELLKSMRADAERQTGEQISAAVITVPAAFGSLQCDATARAAKLAGIEESRLLQEPIAAAIAYGASPGAGNQRWMVFDLGGGTLDIAIVSTRNDRLAVLDHEGNNRLGGKEIDRIIAESFLLPPLVQAFHVPELKTDQQAFQRLMRRLTRHAEQAKIALSTAGEVDVEMFDLGQDVDGNQMELACTLKRSDMEAKIAPVIEQCLNLAKRAMKGARVSAGDLDRILLVGGPTQMPVIRAALADQLGVGLDHTLDPMTVVSHGAAIFASTLERETSSTPAAAATSESPAASASSGPVKVQLSFERASGTLASPVVGVFGADTKVHEVKIDGSGGHWTSGWLQLKDGCFQTDVILQDGKPATLFALSARDQRGNVLVTEPREFSIARMRSVSSPPLPHAVAIELTVSHGISTFDPIFHRHSPLPAEVKKIYKTDRALRPSDLDAVLPIKFWEIDVSEDPQEKWWAGCINLSSRALNRPMFEGAEIELTIKIDASRKMSVGMFIPQLNQSFQTDVYIPDPPTARLQLQQQIDLCFDRLRNIKEEIYAGDHEDLTGEYEDLEGQLEAIAEQFGTDVSYATSDPDAVLRSTPALRTLRIKLGRMEERLNITSAKPTMERKMRWFLPLVERNAIVYGTPGLREEFGRLKSQYERYAVAGDMRGQTWVHDQLSILHRKLVYEVPAYWKQQFEFLVLPDQRFINQEQAKAAIADGNKASEAQDLPALRSACQKLWGLQPKDELEQGRNREAQSGLRSV